MHLEMGPKKSKSKSRAPAKERSDCSTSTMESATKICKKYGKRHMTPEKKERIRKALCDISAKKSSIRQAAEENELSYSFLQRRVSGEVSEFSRNGPPPMFTEEEEIDMAKMLSEMSLFTFHVKSFIKIPHSWTTLYVHYRYTPPVYPSVPPCL